MKSRARRVLPRQMLRYHDIWSAQRQIAAFAPRVVEHSYHGLPLKLWIHDPVGERWYDHEWPESVLPELEYLRATPALRGGATVFDVGAHQGVVALMMGCLVGLTGTVVAVEPARIQLAAITHNLVLNQMPQVHLVPAAAGATDCDLYFDRYGAAVSPDKVGAEKIPAVTVDQLTDTYGPPDLLWVDVEGFEHRVLEGARQTLRHRPYLCVEVHAGSMIRRQGGSTAMVLEFLTDGYELLANEAPNDRVHRLAPLDPAHPPEERFSVVAVPR